MQKKVSARCLSEDKEGAKAVWTRKEAEKWWRNQENLTYVTSTRGRTPTVNQRAA